LTPRSGICYCLSLSEPRKNASEAASGFRRTCARQGHPETGTVVASELRARSEGKTDEAAGQGGVEATCPACGS
jgi:hypothetical protein